MANPTKAQWEEVKNKLSHPYGTACFRCDSYLIEAQVRQSKMKLVIQVYVNGWIKGQWWWHGNERDIGKMPEIAKRFYCLKKKGLSAKKIALNHKIFGKKTCREKGYNNAFYSATPWFNTPGGFVTHLKKHNPSIEIIDFDTYKAEREALFAAEGDGNA